MYSLLAHWISQSIARKSQSPQCQGLGYIEDGSEVDSDGYEHDHEKKEQQIGGIEQPPGDLSCYEILFVRTRSLYHILRHYCCQGLQGSC